MKTSEVFALVKVGLWNGRGMWTADGRYICYRLDYLHTHERITKKDRYRCKRIINNLLDGNASLEGWLWVKHNIFHTETHNNPRKMQATRQAWLDHLIAHYQSKGD